MTKGSHSGPSSSLATSTRARTATASSLSSSSLSSLSLMWITLIIMTIMMTICSAFQPAAAIVSSSSRACAVLPRLASSRLFASSSSSSSTGVTVSTGVSRIDTLQEMLVEHGAPGSQGCAEAGDLVAVSPSNGIGVFQEYPELASLHPHLFPIAKSTKTGNYICALRRAYANDAEYESSSNAPWPIVESALNAPGMQLLALNSEHLMRRIACENDVAEAPGRDLVSLYNTGLGNGKLAPALDAPYESGSVDQLGYGLDKYVLLRVGPFPDLYGQMAITHKAKGDESSSLIAAEAANGKFSGFASSFREYAKLLVSFPNREEEARDAARICLRMALPSIGLDMEHFKEVSVLGQIGDESDSDEEVCAKLQEMYEKLKAAEEDEQQPGTQSKTREQVAIDDANYLLDTTCLTTKDWASIRPRLADIYASAGREDMASFVDPNRG